MRVAFRGVLELFESHGWVLRRLAGPTEKTGGVARSVRYREFAKRGVADEPFIIIPIDEQGSISGELFERIRGYLQLECEAELSPRGSGADNPPESPPRRFPLRGRAYTYVDPLEPAVGADDWEALP
ncbi:MAG: hypothetical protein HZB38_05675 [Planctomycetes bacterium]|nr:hypothetical protein [Planctomycetota bacterium]